MAGWCRSPLGRVSSSAQLIAYAFPQAESWALAQDDGWAVLCSVESLSALARLHRQNLQLSDIKKRSPQKAAAPQWPADASCSQPFALLRV